MANVEKHSSMRVVVGVDGSEQSKEALRWAARVAGSVGADIEVVAAWDLSTRYSWTEVPNRWDPWNDTKKALDAVVDEVFGAHRPPAMDLTVHEGVPAKVLLDRAEGALMLVVGSRGHGGFAGLLLGSVSASVAEHASCPVLVVHGGTELGTTEATASKHVVVGVDGSTQSKQALRWAARLATSVGAHLDAVGAWDLPTSVGWVTVYPEWDPAKDMMEVLTTTVADVFGGNRPAELAVAAHQGGAAGVLLDQAAGALILVVGSRGHGGFAGLLLGSVSASVAEHARCPVLVVHGDAEPPDFMPM